MYEIKIESKTRKIIKKLPRKLQEIIDAEIGEIRENPLTIYLIGPHENFYRDLKRYLKLF